MYELKTSQEVQLHPVLIKFKSVISNFGVRIFHYLIILLGCLAIPAASHGAEPNAKYSFCDAPFIHPNILRDLTTALSDSGDQVVAINLTDSQEANRYAAELHVDREPGRNPLVYVGGDTEKFSYQYVGETKSGIHILHISQWPGGSGVFESFMLLTVERDKGLTVNWKKGLVLLDRERFILKKLGEIFLGDRWQGELRIEGDTLFVGKDEGWFSTSGGTGGSKLSQDSKEYSLKIAIEHQPKVTLCK